MTNEKLEEIIHERARYNVLELMERYGIDVVLRAIRLQASPWYRLREKARRRHARG